MPRSARRARDVAGAATGHLPRAFPRSPVRGPVACGSCLLRDARRSAGCSARCRRGAARRTGTARRARTVRAGTTHMTVTLRWVDCRRRVIALEVRSRAGTGSARCSASVAAGAVQLAARLAARSGERAARYGKACRGSGVEQISGVCSRGTLPIFCSSSQGESRGGARRRKNRAGAT